MSSPEARPLARNATTVRILVLQHECETGLGAFAALLDEAQIDYEVVETLRGALPDPAAFDGAIALGGSTVNQATSGLLPRPLDERTATPDGLPRSPASAAPRGPI